MHDRWPFRGLVAAPRLRRPTGQSLVEFTLILPVLLLLLMGGIDFGRVFLGWVSLNNTARIAANYAAANALSVSAGNATALATYNRLVQDDAKATNCTPDDPIAPPTYDPDTDRQLRRRQHRLPVRPHHADPVGDLRRARGCQRAVHLPDPERRHREYDGRRRAGRRRSRRSRPRPTPASPR